MEQHDQRYDHSELSRQLVIPTVIEVLVCPRESLMRKDFSSVIYVKDVTLMTLGPAKQFEVRCGSGESFREVL